MIILGETALKIQIIIWNCFNSVFFLLLPKSCTQPFFALKEGNVMVEMLFPEPIIARYLRILPSACRGKCAMKFEVLGVNLTDCPLGESMFSLSVCRGKRVWSFFYGSACVNLHFFLPDLPFLSPFLYPRPSRSVRRPLLPPSLHQSFLRNTTIVKRPNNVGVKY